MTTPLRLRVINSVEAIGQANATVMAWLEANHIPPAPAVLASLALEELVTNCIKYGYPDSNEHVIDVDMRVDDGNLVLRFADDGREFNPLEVPAPDLSLPLEQRPIGGLGLFLLKTMADNVTYERRGGMNCLTLIKRIE